MNRPNHPPTPSPVSAASPPAKRKWYDKDFQRNAVRLVTDESYSFKAAADAVGVCPKSIRDWYKKYGPASATGGDESTADQLRDENKRLRKQLKRAEMERDILKKATAYFAAESQ